MLQQLQAKVEEEGKVAEDLYEKFMCPGTNKPITIIKHTI